MAASANPLSGTRETLLALFGHALYLESEGKGGWVLCSRPVTDIQFVKLLLNSGFLLLSALCCAERGGRLVFHGYWTIGSGWLPSCCQLSGEADHVR